MTITTTTTTITQWHNDIEWFGFRFFFSLGIIVDFAELSWLARGIGQVITVGDALLCICCLGHVALADTSDRSLRKVEWWQTDREKTTLFCSVTSFQIYSRLNITTKHHSGGWEGAIESGQKNIIPRSFLTATLARVTTMPAGWVISNKAEEFIDRIYGEKQNNETSERENGDISLAKYSDINTIQPRHCPAPRLVPHPKGVVRTTDTTLAIWKLLEWTDE